MINMRFFSFEWDAEKESKNIQKHGVDFRTAKLAFRDSNLLMIRDRKIASWNNDIFVLEK